MDTTPIVAILVAREVRVAKRILGGQEPN